MKTTRILQAIAGTALTVFAATEAVEAHHSYAIYDLQKSVTITGTVSAFEWTNPHSTLAVVVPEEGGGQTEWWVEMGSIGRIARGGWHPDTVQPGDEITVEIYPLKGGAAGGSFLYATLEDGRKLGETGSFINLPAPGGDEEGLRQAEREDELLRARRRSPPPADNASGGE